MTMTAEIVRHHDARTKHGWGRWLRIDGDGTVTHELLRFANGHIEQVRGYEPIGHGTTRVDIAELHHSDASWCPLDYETREPVEFP